MKRLLFASAVTAALAAYVGQSFSFVLPVLAQQRRGSITDVAGIKVGQHTLAERPTGCTVILVDGQGVPGGVAQRGAAPGTRETDLLDPSSLVDKVNAIVLAGGSAFGLDAAQGVVTYLDERKIGWDVGASGVVPIVPAAILFDLGFGGGNPRIRPAADCGYRAVSAASNGPVAEGNVGAGAGATVGKLQGAARAMKGGIGTASITLPNGMVVGAIAAVNASGDIIDPATGRVVAGVRTQDGKALADVRTLLRSGALGGPPVRPGGNTTIAVVATNARLTKAEANRMALMADDGLSRAISPAHTMADGDTVFSLATGRWDGTPNVTVIGALAADALSEAILRAVTEARASGGLPAARDLGTVPARLR